MVDLYLLVGGAGLVGVVLVLLIRRLRGQMKPEDAAKALKAIKEGSRVPEGVRPQEGRSWKETEGSTAPPTNPALTEIASEKVIPIELTKVKGNGRAVVVRGKARVKPNLLGQFTMHFFRYKDMAYLIKLSKIIEVEERAWGKVRKVEKLVYDILYSEPLNQDGTITWDWDLEQVITDSGMDQYVQAATFEQGVRLDAGLVKILAVVGFFGILFGMGINGAAHLVPITVVHWLP